MRAGSLFLGGILSITGLMCSRPAVALEPAAERFDLDSLVTLLELVIAADTESARQCLAVLTEKIQNGEVSPQQIQSLRLRLADTLDTVIGDEASPLNFDASLLAASWNDIEGVRRARTVFADAGQTPERRLRALAALIAAGDGRVLDEVSRILAQPNAGSVAFRAAVLDSLGRLDKPQVAVLLLASYSQQEPSLRPKIIEVLTQRTAWSKALLQAIGRDQIPAAVLDANQVRKLLASRDAELKQLVIARWGTVRTERNAQREQVIQEMRNLMASQTGDPHHGQLVFQRVCGQCHKIYGEGQDVGPDITGNGRASFEQLLSNVFDPSLVIGAAYQARTVVTTDGRVLSGLLVEDNELRVVLKTQGGKQETIARDDLDEVFVSQLSLMPEGVEKQLSTQEIVDLFAFLMLDQPPEDPSARLIPGTPSSRHSDETVPENPMNR